MDKDTKSFFEKLAGVKPIYSKEEEIEIEAEPKKILIEENEEGPVVEETIVEEISDEPDGELALDVYQTPMAFIVESAIAGVNPDDIELSITPESVSIKGKREKIEKIKTENYIHQECFWGSFSRTIILPQEIDADKAQASLKNGVLKITLPKLNRNKAKKVKVKFE